MPAMEIYAVCTKHKCFLHMYKHYGSQGSIVVPVVTKDPNDLAGKRDIWCPLAEEDDLCAEPGSEDWQYQVYESCDYGIRE